MKKLQCVPPSPGVIAMLFMDYRRSGLMKKMTFREYLKSIGFTDPSKDIVGMDDAAFFVRGPEGPQMIEIPSRPVTGKLQVKVLLADFPDRQGSLPAEYYQDMLFSKNSFPTGSLRDYYKEVSLGKVEVSGSVHGWLRMPNPYAYYANGQSGMGERSYPHNAQRMAEDAVKAALQNGITFEKELDTFNQGIITALFIVHAGRGAEEMHPSISDREIWSHKWNLRNPVDVADDLTASIYLTVPHDCKVGVCAHELGHLAFQWQDFYNPNYAEDGNEWDGAGVWDLMAGGSYNGNGARPAHPAGLHKLQHGWVRVTTVKKSKKLTIRPYTAKSGRVYRIQSPNYGRNQYLILENRKRTGFDFHLPGEGLLVWRIDERGEMYGPGCPGMLLIQADGQHHLETPSDGNEGDAGDPFPGKTRRTQLKDTGSICTSFPKCGSSGIKFENISVVPSTGAIKVDVKIFGGANGRAAKKPKHTKKSENHRSKNTTSVRRESEAERASD